MVRIEQIRFKQLAAVFIACIASTAVAQGPRVSLEVITEPGFSQESIREWLPLLEKAGFNSVRVRGGQSGDGAAVRSSGTGSTISYEVTGVLTGDNRLRLPNGNFSAGSGSA